MGSVVRAPGILCVDSGTDPTAIHCGIRRYKTPFLQEFGTCIEGLRNSSCSPPWKGTLSLVGKSYYSIGRARAILGDGLGSFRLILIRRMEAGQPPAIH